MKKLIMSVAAALMLGGAYAQQTPMEPAKHWITPLCISLASPLQLPPSSWVVDGIRLNLLYGDSYAINGIDLGLVGRTRNDLNGIAAGLFNWVDGDMRGIQLGALANVGHVNSYGLQLGGAVNYVYNDFGGVQAASVNLNGSFYGLQAGAVNWDKGISYGLQLGAVNADLNEFNGGSVGAVNWAIRYSGAQVGFVNICTTGEGCQIGVFNAAETYEGIQIGLLNIIQKGAMPIMCLMNANF